MSTHFKHIVLMVKDILASVKFYSQGLGLIVTSSSSKSAELNADGTIIVLHVGGENAHSGGSPVLSFHVDDIYAAIMSLEAMGAKLETQVLEESGGRVAAIRTPDGHRLSLLQLPSVSVASLPDGEQPKQLWFKPVRQSMS